MGIETARPLVVFGVKTAQGRFEIDFWGERILFHRRSHRNVVLLKRAVPVHFWVRGHRGHVRGGRRKSSRQRGSPAASINLSIIRFEALAPCRHSTWLVFKRPLTSLATLRVQPQFFGHFLSWGHLRMLLRLRCMRMMIIPVFSSPVHGTMSVRTRLYTNYHSTFEVTEFFGGCGSLSHGKKPQIVFQILGGFHLRKFCATLRRFVVNVLVPGDGLSWFLGLEPNWGPSVLCAAAAQKYVRTGWIHWAKYLSKIYQHFTSVLLEWQFWTLIIFNRVLSARF